MTSCGRNRVFSSAFPVEGVCTRLGSILTVVNWRLQHTRVLGARLDCGYAFDAAVRTAQHQLGRVDVCALGRDDHTCLHVVRLCVKALDLARLEQRHG